MYLLIFPYFFHRTLLKRVRTLTRCCCTKKKRLMTSPARSRYQTSMRALLFSILRRCGYLPWVLPHLLHLPYRAVPGQRKDGDLVRQDTSHDPQLGKKQVSLIYGSSTSISPFVVAPQIGYPRVHGHFQPQSSQACRQCSYLNGNGL